MDGKSWLAVLTFFLTATFPTALRADTVDDYVNAEMAHRYIPVVALTVVQNGRESVRKAMGVAPTSVAMCRRIQTCSHTIQAKI